MTASDGLAAALPSGEGRDGRWLGTLDDCVHCGFCLPACPTYDLWGQEMDSPRGRIWLMRAVAEGGGVDATFVRHMDACLGCLACVSACPSGVDYGDLIETARATIEDRRVRGWGERLLRALLLSVMPRPSLLRLVARAAWWLHRLGLRRMLHASGVAGRLPRRLRALEALLPARAPARRVAGHAAESPASPRLRVALLTGCVQSVWFAEVNAAAQRVLRAEGCAVSAPAAQCCGALELHAGRRAQALERARAMIAEFEAQGDLDAVAVTAAGCGSAMKDYGRLLADDPAWAERAAAFSAKVADVTEVLAGLDAMAPRGAVRARIAYQDACHLLHGQGVQEQPRALLAAIPGVELVELPEAAVCCGSAGIYNVLEPHTAEQLGERKAAIVRTAAPDILATANPGCALQLARHLGPDVRIVHPVQLLDESIHSI